MAFPWSVVGERDAVSLASPAPRIADGTSVTYAFGPAATVVIVEAGDRPTGSGVQARERLTLVEPFPNEAANGLDTSRPILGFVRLPDGLLPLGPLRPTYSRHQSAPTGAPSFQPLNEFGRLITCQLTMKPLPFTVLDRVRPTLPPPQLPDLDWIQLLPHDVIGALRAFVAGWYTDLPPAGDETPDGDIPLPEPLRAFYRAVAGRPDLLGVHNRIYPAESLRRDEDGMVIFGTENQGVFQLRMDPAQADPPVDYDGIEVDPAIAREPLSGFLLQFLLSEAATAGPFSAHATISDDQLPHLLARLHPVPLHPMPAPSDPTLFYAGDGLTAAIADLGDNTVEVHVGSRHRSALRPLREPGFSWKRFDG